MLEEAAAVPRPGLRHRDYRTIREFLAYLQKEFSGITDELVDKYIREYERARFSEDCFDVDDYSHFMCVMLEIVEKIQ